MGGVCSKTPSNTCGTVMNRNSGRKLRGFRARYRSDQSICDIQPILRVSVCACPLTRRPLMQDWGMCCRNIHLATRVWTSSTTSASNRQVPSRSSNSQQTQLRSQPPTPNFEDRAGNTVCQPRATASSSMQETDITETRQYTNGTMTDVCWTTA